MTNPGMHHHVEIKEGDDTVAAADVTIPAETEGTAQASLHSSPGHVTPGRRASLVDAVMDLPEVKESSRLEAVLPLGDSETLGRLRERSENVTTRPAGSSALVDADIPAPAGDVPAPPAGDVPPAALGEVPPAAAGEAAPPPAE
jgi:hypothetical protein